MKCPFAKWFFFFLVLLTSLHCAGDKDPVSDLPGEMKVGLLAPFDGHYYPYLISLHRGADMVLDKAQNIQGIYENSYPHSYHGQRAIQKLFSNSKISAIIGPAEPGAIVRARKILNQQSTIHFSCFSNPIGYNGDNTFSFSNVPSDEKQISLMYSFVLQHFLVKKVAIIYEVETYQEVLLRKFLKPFIEADVQVNLVSLDKTQVQVDLRSPDAVIILTQHPSTVKILEHILAQHATLPILCREGAIMPDQIPNISQANIYCVRLPIDRSRLFFRRFSKEFRRFHARLIKAIPNWFMDEPNVYDAYAYEAAMIITEAINEVGTAPDSIRQYLLSKSFNSFTGDIYFNHRGEVNRDYKIAKLVDGQGAFIY